MKLGKRTALAVAAAGALVTLVFGASPAVAHEDPVHHPASCWDVTKVAKDSHGNPITSLTLSLGQTFTIHYEIAVTKRECGEGETGHPSVNVVDSHAGTLATHMTASHTFRYTRDVTAHSCDSFEVHNTVEVWNQHLLAQASASVQVTVACEQGCTLTQGYWKTHSEFGPAPYDDTWAQLPNGASTTFFLSGASWIDVFWTAPSGGNVYYQLAHQYMAAKLNILNGASAPSAVVGAIAAAETFFGTYTPDQAGGLDKKSQARSDAIAAASTLASYNEGAIGPGHCDE